MTSHEAMNNDLLGQYAAKWTKLSSIQPETPIPVCKKSVHLDDALRNTAKHRVTPDHRMHLYVECDGNTLSIYSH